MGLAFLEEHDELLDVLVGVLSIFLTFVYLFIRVDRGETDSTVMFVLAIGS